MEGLTTHVLDSLHGTPAVRVHIELWQFPIRRFEGGVILSESYSNSEGRAAMIGDLHLGEYELRFGIGDYFRRKLNQPDEPSFLDIVPIRFQVVDSKQHYHIPLVSSPWAYSTYKGGALKYESPKQCLS